MATTKNEVIFDLDAPAFSSDEFRMFEFKVKRCPRVIPHDWACCPFSHINEKAKRRDPRLCKYSGTACPEFRRNGCCRRSDQCPFAHGIFECWMHPSRYRTQMCSEVLECKRRVCFFAHTEAELRRPVDDATWMQQHGSLVDDSGMLLPEAAHADTLAGLAGKAQPHGPIPAAMQGLIPAVHGHNSPASGQNPAVWPLLQQLAASGQIDASQLMSLVTAMGTATASGTSTPSGPKPTSLLENNEQGLRELNATLAALEGGSAHDAPDSSINLPQTIDLEVKSGQHGSWGSDGGLVPPTPTLLPADLMDAAAGQPQSTSAAAVATSITAAPVQDGPEAASAAREAAASPTAAAGAGPTLTAPAAAGIAQAAGAEDVLLDVMSLVSQLDKAGLC